ncbi:DUF2750 domain-containing protein [Rossellomorea vietnamensis]|uniref:DUF2750 domain-containing protein n=1 Tax=Rossellomorea vietnamensis TaxID=218284 RepID=A0A5D4NTV0_9BACI|nr:DUF2750 domain-containing protein [Rossellomorea vietnamensis]TYS17753.1 DUF2750 domain-containing protein [Rossellomorea vietnamensis]
MDKKEFDSVSRLPAAVRYEYFIKKVADHEEVWGLYNEGWATAHDEEGKVLIPFFPRREFAESCAKDKWTGYHAKSVELDDFVDKWLAGMKEKGIRPSIFPVEEDTAVVEIEVLLNDLEAELENY